MVRLLSSLLAAASMYAQTITSSISGVVVDPGGLAVAGAEVTLQNPATGAARSARSNALGDFVFGSVTPGSYALSITAAGFKRLERTNVSVSASETLALGNLALQVGQVNESVTVSDVIAQVQTASAERAGTITSKQVDSVLIRGRNVMSLLQLLPGVVDNGENESISRDWNINVNGNRRNTSSVSLDGMALNAIGNNNNATVSVSQDAVAEVRILLSNYQAEFGRMSGANIQLVTKSGTKQFHGLGSYFKRHEQFNANNFFNNLLGQPKPRYRFNTWNYNVGGPAFIPGVFNKNREKLFFFFSQEYWPLKVNRPLAQLTVPTALERRGDYSLSNDLNNRQIVVRDPNNNRNPFPGNVIPANRVDSNGQALLNVFPQPNFLDRTISAGRYNYVFVGENETPQRTETLKLDYNINANNILTGNYTRYSDVQTGYNGIASSGGTNWEQMRKTFDNQGRAYLIRYQRIFSPTLVNEFNWGFVGRPANDVTFDDEVKRNLRSTVGFRTPQLNPASNPLNVIPNATFGGVSQPANLMIEGRFPLRTTHDSMTATNTVTKTMRAHTIKAGFYWDRIWRNADNAVVFNGEYNFGTNANNPLDTGYAYANAALGVFNSYTEASARPFAYFRLSNVEWFAQDNWKVTRRFTLDYGVRWAVVSPLYEDFNNVSGFVPERWQASRAPQLIEGVRVNNVRMGRNPVTGAAVPATFIGALAPGNGDPANGMVVTKSDTNVPRAFLKNRGPQWGPRFGFAWDVFGNQRTAVRGGFGMFYNRQNLDAVLNPFTTAPPIVQTPVVNFSTLAGLANSGGLLFPQNVIGIDGEGKIPTVMNYSLSVQQNVGFQTILDVAYVANLARNQMWQRNLNAIPFGANFLPQNQDASAPGSPLPQAFLRPLRGYNNVNFREWASSSNYHSMQVQANRRFSAGLQFIASWTWSKSMDFNSNDTDAVSPLVDPRVWNYGLSSYDRTHVAKFSGVWDLPKTTFQNVIAKQIFNDWQMSGIVTFSSGQPLGLGFGTVTPLDITGSPTDGPRITLTGNPILPKGDRTRTRFFDTSVVRLPARGTIGNAAKTNIRGPGINNWDTAFFKNFPIREEFRMQLRWELYNIWNHSQFTGVDTTARFDAQGAQGNARLGELISARPARIMQFALRLYF
ncbi:MAG: carboxypeptidase regulatory-like domain-containing protein [Acidobacteria bacterium]|nr:carboxypeptidase regulatory-like domain-containing protein [Acidobacteriota bacterium]